MSQSELADLSALADGTLDSARTAEVRERISASAELTALYQREVQVLELLHAARTQDRAPARLRARIEAGRPSAAVLARRRVRYGGALAGALAAVALALVLVLPAGAPGGPSVSQAAALGTLGPSAPPPVPDPTAPRADLDRNIEYVYFPNWESRFGWRAIGQRTDRLDGRRAVTVFYEWHGRRLAYTIVAAPALSQPAARVRVLADTELRTLTLNGRLVVTWRRANHTCVLSSVGVPASELQTLAAWKAPADPS